MVSDLEVFVTLHSDGPVNLRDMRPGPPVSVPQRIYGEFVSELFTPGRFSFCACIGLGAATGVGIVVADGLRPDSFLWIGPICAVSLLAIRALICTILKTNHKRVARTR